MVKTLDPPILIFPTLPSHLTKRLPKRLAKWRPHSNWPEYCLFVTILICVPLNLLFWGRTPEAKAAPKSIFGSLVSLSTGVGAVVSSPTKTTPKLASVVTATPAATAGQVPTLLPPALGPTAKANPPAPVLHPEVGTSNNAYSYGQCTWYVAGRRAVPGHWGNARNWYSNAQAAGWKVGTAPEVNAIAWTSAGWFGHVAYVEDVDGDRVLIAEMNNYGVRGGGWNRVDRRWVNAGEFKYIY